MSNKITGSDLKRLINEAMGLKVETDEDNIGFDSELGDELFDAPPVEDPIEPEEPEDTEDAESATKSNVSDKSVPGEALFYPRWEPGKVKSKDDAVKAMKDYKRGRYYKQGSGKRKAVGIGHEEAIYDLAKIANSDYYFQATKPEFFKGELSDGKIFDFLSSDDDKRNQILGASGSTKPGLNAARRIKKYLNNLAKTLPKSYKSERAMAASLATKDPRDLEKTKKDAFARPRISFDKQFSQRGQIKTIPRYIKSVFDALISTNTSAEERIKILTDISVGLTKVKDTEIQPQAARPVKRAEGLMDNQKFSSLILVDFFRQITQFSKSTPLEAGNFFESFLALLFNGTVEGGKYDLEDVLLPFTGEANGTTSTGEPAFISAKFIGNQTNVSQSGDTVNKFFQVHGENAKIMYIVAEKDFYKVTTGTKVVDGEEVETKSTTPRTDYRGMKIYVKTYSKKEIDDREGVVFYKAGENITIRDTDKTEEKPAKGSGKFVFTSVFDPDNFVGEFKFAINEEIYKKKMEQKFKALQLGISKMYASLNNLEENLTIYYSSPLGDTKKEKAAEDAQENINEIDKNYNDNIAEPEVDMAKRKKATRQIESKQLVDIKKLIEESFKK